jgi:hypothetical protein
VCVVNVVHSAFVYYLGNVLQMMTSMPSDVTNIS